MRKHFCDDNCGAEMQPRTSNKVERVKGKVRVSISAHVIGHEGDVCEPCVLDAATKGKPPKPEPEVRFINIFAEEDAAFEPRTIRPSKRRRMG